MGGPAAGDGAVFVEAFEGQGVGVHVGLKAQGFDGGGVEGYPSVVFLDVVLAGVPAGVVGLEAGGENPEVFGEL